MYNNWISIKWIKIIFKKLKEKKIINPDRPSKKISAMLQETNMFFYLALSVQHEFWSNFASLLKCLNYFIWLRINDEGSVPEMPVWSILLIKYD